MKSAKPVFTIVVCCYNGADKLPATIRSLRRLKYPKDKYEIVVIDDGSADQTTKVAKRFKGVRVVTHEVNRGIATARNSGLEAATGRWIAYIDDDCTALPTWLTELESALKKPNTTAAGGLIVARDTKVITQRYLITSGYGRPASISVGAAKGAASRFLAYLKDKYQAVRQKPTDETVKVHEVYGANVAFSTAKLRSIKGFNRELNTSEDADVCTRMQQRYPTKAIRFNPKAVVEHDYTSSFPAYLKKLFVRQVDTLSYYRQQSKTPPLYPFPIGVVLLAAAGAFITPWLGAALLLVVPLVLYGWWPVSALHNRKPEHLFYAYMEWLEESTRVLGLVRAAIIARPKTRSTPEAISRKQPIKKPSSTLPGWPKRTIFAAFGLLIVTANLLQYTHGLPQMIVMLLTLVTVPGLLLALALRLPLQSIRSSMYVLGLSSVLLTLIALATDCVVLLTNHHVRLSGGLFLAVTDVSLFLLGVLAWFRSPSAFTLPSIRISQAKVLAILLAVVLPFLGALASLYLNKSGNNALSMATLGVMFAGLIALLAYLKRLPVWMIALALYSLSLTIMLMGALRGTGVSGTDISKEFYLYGLVQHLGYWSPSIYADPYNACLTIHLLPALFADLLKVSGEAVYRVLLPAIYALVPVMMYALYRRFNARIIAFAGVLFFMIQPVFMKWSAIPVRQMMAFVFFAGLLLALFDKRLPRTARYIMMCLFGGGVILSHYSTAYITLGILALTFVCIRAWHLIDRYVNKSQAASFRPLITLPLLVFLFAVAFVWYGPVTHASGHALSLFRSGITAISKGNANLFGSKAHSEQSSLFDQFNINSTPRQPAQVWSDYRVALDTKYKNLHITPLQNKYAAAPITAEAPATMPYKVPSIFGRGLTFLGQVMSKLTRVFLVIGLAIAAYQFVRRRGAEHEFNILAISSAIAIVLIIIVPYASIDYDIGRTSQQLLMLLALPTVGGAFASLRFVTRDKFAGYTYGVLAASFIIATFLFISSFIAQLTGGQQPNMVLNNSGVQYQIAVKNGETAGAEWLAANHDSSSRIYSGYFGRNRLWTAGIPRSSLYNDILPWTIDKHAYVYASYSEVADSQGTTYYNGSFVTYAYPSDLLQARKDIIYSNNQARIYK